MKSWSRCHFTSPFLILQLAKFKPVMGFIFSDVSVVLDLRPVFMQETFMADLAGPLKHD